MRRRTILKKIIISFILVFIFTLPIAAQEYPITITEQGYIFMEVTLVGNVKANFMLDTGGGGVFLSGKTFEKIKNQTASAGLFTGFRHDGERLDGEVFTIPSIAIGDISQTNIISGVYPPLDEYGIEGLVGLKFFENTPFTIDFKNKILRFENSQSLQKLESANKSIPISFATLPDFTIDMFIPICINGKTKIRAEFDTGSGYNLLLINPFYIEKLELDTSGVTPIDHITPITKKKLIDYQFSLESVELCESEMSSGLENATATFREDLIYEGLIGCGMFKDKALTIDIPHKRIFVQN